MPKKGDYSSGANERSVYQREYQGSPEQKKRRAERNKARRAAIKKHGKSALKGKDVGHVNPSRTGNIGGPTRIQSESSNSVDGGKRRHNYNYNKKRK